MGRRIISIIKFLIFISIIILSLGITISYAINQQSTFDDARVVLGGNRQVTVGHEEKVYISIEDLDKIGSIMCSALHTALPGGPGSVDTVVDSWKDSTGRIHNKTSITDQGNEIAYLTELLEPEVERQTIFRDENGAHADEVKWTDWTEEAPVISSEEVINRTTGLFNIGETKIATPKEAYILAYLGGGNGVTAKSDCTGRTY